MLDEDYVENATSLAIARTIIHESIHAFLSYSISINAQSTFAALFQRYVEENEDSNTNDIQHELMYQFTEALGESLASWDGHRLNDEYYENLAWSGDMLESEAFDKLSNERKQAIRDANRAEGNAVQSATNKAKGEKCD